MPWKVLERLGWQTCTLFAFGFPLISLFLFSTGTYAEVTFDGTIGVEGTLPGPVYDITSDYGVISGDNLFHSFGQFNISTGENAVFSGPTNIENIIGRVTGGPSTIDGTISSSIPGADLYLLNPYGVMFGPDARLDLKGSFHVSTADYIRFVDGEQFYADPYRTSVLSVASPASFGFLSDTPASITIQGSMLEVPEGKILSVIAGDINLEGPTLLEEDFTLQAPGGRVNVVSTASAGEAILDVSGNSGGVDVSSFTLLGDISMSEGAEINASGEHGGGTVTIRGGQFVMEDLSIIAAHNYGETESAAVAVDMEIDGTILISKGQIIASSYAAGDSGDIKVAGEEIVMDGSGTTGPSDYPDIHSYAWASGDSGDIEITAGSLTLQKASIGSYTFNEGDGGSVRVTVTENLDILDKGFIAVNGINDEFANPGDSGDLIITSGSLLLTGSESEMFTGLANQAHGGNCGDLLINTGQLRIEGAAEIANTTFGQGSAGLLDITAESIFISGSENYKTGIFANTWGSGMGGDLVINAGIIEITDRGSIQAGTFFDGSSPGSGTGDAGSVDITTESLSLSEGATISTSGYFGAGGDAGDIEIKAAIIEITGFEDSNDPFLLDGTGITAANRDGNCGDILLLGVERLSLDQRALIATSSFGAGLGGNILIDSTATKLLDGSGITASAFGSGNGGNIEIFGESLELNGVNEHFYTDVAGSENLAKSNISSQAALQYGGDAGDILIDVDYLEILDGAQVSANTFGPGDGGNVNVTAGEILISGQSAHYMQYLVSGGVDTVFAGSGIYTETSGYRVGDLATGNAGTINVSAEHIRIEDGGVLFSGTDTPGSGGDINISAAFDVEIDGGTISARSTGYGDAGNIHISAGDSFTSRNGSVTTEATQAGGGTVDIEASHMVYLQDSEVTTAVQLGSSDAGNITIDPEFVILSNSSVVANAYEGDGGNILIIADFYLADYDSTVDASSTLGIDGEVDIRALYKNFSEGILPLPEDYTENIALLREPCLARVSGGGYSSLLVKNPEGLPLAPGYLLPSPVYLESEGSNPSPSTGSVDDFDTGTEKSNEKGWNCLSNDFHLGSGYGVCLNCNGE